MVVYTYIFFPQSNSVCSVPQSPFSGDIISADLYVWRFLERTTTQTFGTRH